MKAFLVLILSAGIFLCNGAKTTDKNVPEFLQDDPDVSNSDKVAFVAAVKRGNATRVWEILEKNHVDGRLNEVKKYGGPLHYVAEYGNGEIVDFLITKGALCNLTNLEEDELSPIHFAALNPDKNVTETLLNRGARLNVISKTKNTVLHFAALNKNKTVMEYLLRNLNEATQYINFENAEKEVPLHWAALNPNEKVTKLLIEGKAVIDRKNSDDNTALHIAAQNSNHRIAELLIKNGADVNAPGKNGWTPMFFAVINGNEHMKKTLKKIIDRDDVATYVKKKAEVYSKHFFAKACAIERANEQIIELLLENGAKINHEDSNGMKPYDLAVAFGDRELSKFLVAHGATEKEIPQKN